MRSWTAWVLILVFYLPGFLLEEDEEESGPLLFLPREERRSLFVNHSFVITCFSPEGVNAVRLTWKGPPGIEITERAGRIHVEESTMKGGMDLFFERVTTRDHGQYECSAIVDGVTVEKTFNLTVYKEISFFNTPGIQYALENTELMVQCSVSGQPMPTMKWRLNGKILAEPKYSMRPEGMLIRNVSRLDSGDYMCRGSQMTVEHSDFKEKLIKVIVQYKPEWKSHMVHKVYSYVGGMVNLTCEADGEPKPTYTWQRDEIDLMPDDRTRIIKDKSQSTIEIHVQAGDFDYYICIAENEFGVIRKDIELKKGERPGVPEVEVLSSSPDAIQLQITGPDNEALSIAAYSLEYRPESLSWNDKLVKEFLIENNALIPINPPFMVEELEQDVAYVVRVAARNTVGLGEFSPEVTIRTGKMKAAPVYDGSAAHAAEALGLLLSTLFSCLTLGIAL